MGADYAIIGKDLSVEEKVYLHISSGVIKKISINSKLDADEYYEDCIIVPGFINMHTHIADTLAKEKAYGLELTKAVSPPSGLKHKILSATSEMELAEAMSTAIREMISRGITTFVDFREGGIAGCKILREVANTFGINAIIMGRPNSSPIEKLFEVADGLGLCSLNAYSDDELLNFRTIARRMNRYIAYHASETIQQREKSIKNFGMSDISRGIKILKPDFIVHLTHADDRDLDLVSANGVLVVLCPRANGYFGLGQPPIGPIIRRNINFCLGTDNVMANSPDLFREFDYIIRIARNQGVTIAPKKLLESVTTIPSKYLHLNTGVIKQGYRADFFIFDLSKPNVAYIEDPIKAIVLRGSESNIISTYLHGQRM